MPAYTLMIQLGGDPTARPMHIQAPDAETAKASALELVEAIVRRVLRGYVAVGCGEGTDLDWLGAWDFERGHRPVWSPDD